MARDEANDRLHRLQDRLSNRDKELVDLKKREAALITEVEALREEIDSDEALTHLMRQHVKCLNAMARAQAELDDIFFSFGSHADLDKYDEKDEVEEVEEAIGGVTGKDTGSSKVGCDEEEAPKEVASKDDASGSVLPEDPLVV